MGILINSFKDLVSFSEYLTKNDLGTPQYIVYNKRVYDYTLLPKILKQKSTKINDIIAPKKLTQYMYVRHPYKQVLSYLLYGVQKKIFYDNN